MTIEFSDAGPELREWAARSLAEAMAEDLRSAGTDLADDGRVAVDLLGFGYQPQMIALLMDRAVCIARSWKPKAVAVLYAAGGLLAPADPFFRLIA